MWIDSDSITRGVAGAVYPRIAVPETPISLN